MPNPDPDYVFVTGDPNRIHVDFLPFPKGSKLTLSSRGKDYPFVRTAQPVRLIWRSDDPNKTPIDPTTISTLPPDTDLIVSNNGKEFTTQAGTVFIPPTPTLATLSRLLRERSGDQGNGNKPSDPDSF